MYSAYTPNCSNVFACVGLKQQSYCILNKQYTKEEYEALVPKIIEHMQETGEWGEFFDPSYSPFGYNESAAWEYFPLEKSQTESFHFPRYEGIPTIFPSSSTLPDSIDDVDDTILSQAIACEAGGKAFKIIAQELAFYRKHGLPIPRISSDMRHLQRFNQKPARTLHLRHCDKCEKEMLSVYP